LASPPCPKRGRRACIVYGRILGLERRLLGTTGLEVSRMCLGTLTVGALQMRMEPKLAADIFEAAFDMGVNFFDSAKVYGSHPHLREFLKRVRREDVIIATKSYDYTYEGMKESLQNALTELGTDYVDIYLMHEQESRATLKGHEEGFRYLLEAKAKGLIRAVGVSTHACEVAEAAPELGFIDVLHPMFNYRSLGFLDGSIGRMEEAVRLAHKAGIGVYAMKVLAGGLIIDELTDAISWAIANRDLDSIALGIANLRELKMDVALFEGRIPSKEELSAAFKTKSIIIEKWCSGCGSCISACKQGAMSIINGKAVVDRSRCVLCGYCGSVCPDFHIRIV
jgi:diketogulonate reductase-like aldo/keto reductase/ferredoxin